MDISLEDTRHYYTRLPVKLKLNGHNAARVATIIDPGLIIADFFRTKVSTFLLESEMY
jgi:hypothetical protein